MSFKHKDYIQKYTKNPKNDATAYGVTIDKAQAQEGELYFQVVGIHHLTPSENRGNRNVYLEVLDENDQRIRGALVNWTWVGRNEAAERANPVLIDKPDYEPGGNIAIGSKQVISVWVAGARSDKVQGLSSVHKDEHGPNGENWNSLGHHSFYVIFKRVKKGGSVPANPAEEPTTPKITKSFVLAEDSTMKVSLIIETK